MFRFEHPEYLYLFVCLPLLLSIFLYYLYYRKKSLQRFGHSALINNLISDVVFIKLYVKFLILFICAGLFILIIAGPQFGSKLSIDKRNGSEIMICLDVSNSMLSTDINPTRLDKAKQILSLLIDKLYNNKIGLIVFAGDAFIQLPITSDFISAKMFLSSIRTDMVPIQGTAIGKAIHLAIHSFTQNKNTVKKNIILITDGENHEDDPIKATKKAIKKNITVHVLGIGSIQGALIPISNGYLKDKKKNIILSKLDENMCKKIAKLGRGIYGRIDNTDIILKILQKKLNKKSFSKIEKRMYLYEEKYILFAWFLLLLLIVEFFYSE